MIKRNKSVKKYRVDRIESLITIKDFRQRNLKRDKNNSYLVNLLRERNVAERFIEKLGSGLNQLLQQYVWSLEFDMFSLDRLPSARNWTAVSCSLHSVAREVGDLLNYFLKYRGHSLLNNDAKHPMNYQNEYLKGMAGAYNHNVELIFRLKLILKESQGKASVNSDRTLETLLLKELEGAMLGRFDLC